jgi:predicted Zn-dependent protease
MVRVILLSLLVSFAVIGCSSSTVPQSVEADASVATTAWLDNRFGFVDSPDLSLLLARMLDRLGSAATALADSGDYPIDNAEQFKSYPWQVFVLDTPKVTAFSAGAGVTVVSRGLFRELRSEGELAAVIAHEMGHHLLGHINTAIAAKGLSESSPAFSFTLENELAADTLAVRILTLARYNPNDLFAAMGRFPLSTDETKNNMVERYSNLKRQLNTVAPQLERPADSREFARARLGL